MEYSHAQIRALSMMGLRGTYGKSLLDLAKENEKIIALSADLGSSSGLDRFVRTFPDRFLNVGIAEQNMIGVAAGLADMDYIPFASTFATFASMRACEFVKHFMGYMGSNIKLVGLLAGYGSESLGNTHCAVEDIAMLRSIPNITIMVPADGLEVIKCVEAAAKIIGPVYLRLTGTMNTPVIYSKDFDFEVGKAIVHRTGGRAALISNGTVFKNVLDAADVLAEEGIETDVIDMHTVKPLDTDILDTLKGKEIIVSVEEHFRVGGLGSAIAEYMTENGYSGRVIRLGAKDQYTDAGSYEYKIHEMGLDCQSIVQSVKAYL